MWNTHCFWVDAHPRQVVVGLQQTVRHGKKLFGVSHCLKKRCWCIVGCLEQHFSFCVACCFLLHVGLLAVMVVGDCVWGVLFENCIVDASIFIF